MLVLVSAVEICLCRLDSRWTPLAAANWRQTGRDAETEVVGVDVLLFGDSLVKTGLVPAILAERHKVTAYNLALLGAPPSASYFLFRRAVEAGARPRAVLIDVMPSLLMTGDPLATIREWTELLRPREILELARIEPCRDLLPLFLLKRYIPSIRYRDDVRKSGHDWFTSHTEVSGVPWTRLHNRQRLKNHGGFIHPSVPSRPEIGPRSDGMVSTEEAPICYPEIWWGRPANLIFLEKFFALAESQSIPVFFLLPPIHPGVQAKRERLGLETPYLSLVRKIQERFPSVIVIDGRHSGFDHGLFWDAFHLGREGATALSQGVADVLDRWIDGTIEPQRWVNLPMFTERRLQLAVEDTNESRIVLRDSKSIH